MPIHLVDVELFQRISVNFDLLVALEQYSGICTKSLVVEIFHSGPKWWSDRPMLKSIELNCLPTVNTEKATGSIRATVPPGTWSTVQTDPTHRHTRSMAQKTALIVYAHQSTGSFNAAVRDVAVQELTEQGYRVVVSDLYAMNFKANATQDDIIGDLKNPELFQYGDETMHAWMEGRLSDDIVAEQRKVEEAELIIFQFPLYWFSVPAIMKGWMDRVLAQGFAFSLEKMYNNGIFKKKKAMLSFSTGATQTMFRPDGINGDINISLWPLQNGTLHFCGFQVLAPQIFWSPAHCPPAVRTAMLEGWRTRLKGLLAEKCLTFAPCEMFDLSFQGGFMLRPKVKEEQESQPFGITTGHHLGKPLPPDNQIKVQPTDENSVKPSCRN
ncbi:NAD(P)H dehydrogenase [quinone] 1 isoform X1 [Thunnus maccoyii]|uniref:NAD(P)H dehydrogenase [quinone] 1 isoform X1 n=2 Tax=Thunnus maccoyii TaxID=8240 RepID=UPI001C4CB931|nr:NAD(P)H dehydrogenase [quinone] 1 isoform X1 [Thunnus maccoyii]